MKRLLILLVLAGCGDGGPGTRGDVCTDVAEIRCTRLYECGMLPAGQSISQCVTSRVGSCCSVNTCDMDSPASSYAVSDCTSDIHQLTCAMVNTTPMSCLAL